MSTGDITIKGINFTPADFDTITNEVYSRIMISSKDPSQYEEVNSLQGVSSLPVFQQIGGTYKLVRVLVSILRGVDGREIHLQKTDTHIQWRWSDDMWNNLVELKEIHGENPVFKTGTTGIEWKYENETEEEWKLLVAYEILKLKFSDLTSEQVEAFFEHIPETALELFQQPATHGASELSKYQVQVTEELNQLADETEQTKVAADTAANRANEIANNPTKIGDDNYVYTYNEETKTYEKTEISVKGDSAFHLWLQEPENTTKTYADYLAYNQLPATEAANRLDQYQTQVTEELTQLATETTQAKADAIQATQRANEIANNPTKIRDDNYVYKYNEETKEYEKTNIYVKGEKGDKGNLLYASFEVDMDSGELVMVMPDDYEGPSFHLSDAGDLVVTING